MYTHRKQTHTSTKTHLLDFYDVFLFIQNLNNKGLLGLGGDFQANFMVWGDSIWLNILHLF